MTAFVPIKCRAKHHKGKKDSVYMIIIGNVIHGVCGDCLKMFKITHQLELKTLDGKWKIQLDLY